MHIKDQLIRLEKPLKVSGISLILKATYDYIIVIIIIIKENLLVVWKNGSMLLWWLKAKISVLSVYLGKI